MSQATFEGVKGYATHERAVKRGEEVEKLVAYAGDVRWTVISLPNGRFAPCFIYNPQVNPQLQPIQLASLANVCVLG